MSNPTDGPILDLESLERWEKDQKRREWERLMEQYR